MPKAKKRTTKADTRTQTIAEPVLIEACILHGPSESVVLQTKGNAGKCKCGKSEWYFQMEGDVDYRCWCGEPRAMRDFKKVKTLFGVDDVDGYCPKCGSDHIGVRYAFPVTDSEDGMIWHDHDSAWCKTCGWQGWVKEFPLRRK